jgi:hypothetical protein
MPNVGTDYKTIEAINESGVGMIWKYNPKVYQAYENIKWKTLHVH